MTEKKLNESLFLGYYVVGFFDLLGQQEHLRNLRSLPNRNDADALLRTREVLRNTYGAVVGMRSFFSDAFNAYAQSRKNTDTSSLTTEQRSKYDELTNNMIQFQGFSDSIVVYLSLNTETAKLPVRGIFGILAAAATTFICCLAAGHPIRGGIDVGLGFEPSDDEIYGPALSRAYAIESRIANYPRIVVGDELVRYLNETQAQPQPDDTDIARVVSKRTAASCLDCLAIDDDGQPIVDYLGPFYRNTIGSVIHATVIDKAYERVIDFSNQYKKAKDSKLAFRYNSLRNYFEHRLPLWSDLPR